MNRLHRRTVIKGALAASVPLAVGFPRSAPAVQTSGRVKKAIVLGMDGLDPHLIRRFMAEGAMPTFKKLIEMGYQFGELGTTNPPQSPVAWSSFISGVNPGSHGIYDFIHRDPKSFIPYMSTSRSFDAPGGLKVGKWKIPLEAGRIELMRRGPALWTALEEFGIPCSFFQIPANFPVTTENVRNVSGMGTPDLLGTYGTFTYFTDAEVPGREKFTGGRVVTVSGNPHRFVASLEGPDNSLRTEKVPTAVELEFVRDPTSQLVKIQVQDKTLLLQKGEWSEWIPLSFELMPMFASVGGMVRFYIQEVHPHLRIYCTPINVDPFEPSLPICSPHGYTKEMARDIGRFYTQGFPQDTKALSMGVLSDEEYIVQANLVVEENMRALQWQLDRFDEGLLFFYFSSPDQNQHMLWRQFDPQHPLYEPDAPQHVHDGLKHFYEMMDHALASVLSKVDSNTALLALSDHGFAPFYREFNLNTWLYREGFLALKDPTKLGEGEFYRNVDWSRTKAYGLGINGLYVNLEGRERRGSVAPDEVAQIKREIIAKLPAVIDPVNQQSVVRKAYDSLDIYTGPYTELAPDIIVGLQRGYRISDDSVLGKLPPDLVQPRTDKWAGDHCIDPEVVPGMLLSNRPWGDARPAIWDLAPSLLALFGVPVPKEMEGKAVLS